MPLVEVVYVSWERAVEMCFKLAKKVADSGFRPDAVVAVLRGGVVPALVVSDILNVEEFYAIRVKHWGIAEEVYKVPVVEQLPQGRLEGRRVLVVDEIADTGKTLEVAVRELRRMNPREVRTSVLHLKPTSSVVPDYYVERLDRWVWVFYPWSTAETLISLAHRELGRGASAEEVLRVAEAIAERLKVREPVRSILEVAMRFYLESLRTT